MGFSNCAFDDKHLFDRLPGTGFSPRSALWPPHDGGRKGQGARCCSRRAVGHHPMHRRPWPRRPGRDDPRVPGLVSMSVKCPKKACRGGRNYFSWYTCPVHRPLPWARFAGSRRSVPGAPTASSRTSGKAAPIRDLPKPPVPDPGSRLRLGRDDEKGILHGAVSPDSAKPLAPSGFMGLFRRKKDLTGMQRSNPTSAPGSRGCSPEKREGARRPPKRHPGQAA